MGLVFNRGEIGAFTGDNNAVLEEKIGGLEKLLRSHQEFIDTGQLQGAGWSSAKGLLRDVFVPLAKLQVQYAELLMRANSKTASLMDSYLSGYDLLIEDGLEEAIRQARALEASIEQRLAMLAYKWQSQPGDPFKGNLEAQLAGARVDIEVCEQQIRKLHDFDNATKGLYNEAKECGQRVESALAAIKGRTWNSGTGRFSTAGINMGWVADIGEYWGKREQSYDKVAWYRAWFGMDRVQAELLAEFDQKFEVYARQQGWPAEHAQYEYVRLLASVKYHGSTSWELAGGVFDAGQCRELLEKLGIGGSDYILFRYAFLKQSDGRDSTGRNQLVSHEVDYLHLVGSLACIIKQERNPFDPGSIVVKAGTSNLFSGGVSGQYYREAATFTGDIRSGSMPYADIVSDVDAINLANIVDNNRNASFAGLLGNYYRGVDDGSVDRRKEFLSYYGGRYLSDGEGLAVIGHKGLVKHFDAMLHTPGTDQIAKNTAEDLKITEEEHLKRQLQARDDFLGYLRGPVPEMRAQGGR